jgi:hypothetical protein
MYAQPIDASKGAMSSAVRAGNKMNSAPLCFIENKSQVTDQNHQPRPDIQFMIKAAPGLLVFIGNGAIHYQFSKAHTFHQISI